MLLNLILGSIRKPSVKPKKYDLSLHDLEKIVKVLKNVAGIGGEPKNIVKVLAEIKECRDLEEKVAVRKSALS